MNALYLSLIDNKVIDPTSYGLKDIKNNMLRLIPNANFETKLFNNPKVLLRYCRFYAKYKMNVIKSDIQIMKKFAYRITTLDN
jgi:tRNA nucleotidyltransferase/poly(A) polymerase